MRVVRADEIEGRAQIQPWLGRYPVGWQRERILTGHLRVDAADDRGPWHRHAFGVPVTQRLPIRQPQGEGGIRILAVVIHRKTNLGNARGRAAQRRLHLIFVALPHFTSRAIHRQKQLDERIL